MIHSIKNTFKEMVGEPIRCPDCGREAMEKGYPKMGIQKYKCSSRDCGMGWGV